MINAWLLWDPSGIANRISAQRDELALGVGYFAALAAVPLLAVVVGPRVTEEPDTEPAVEPGAELAAEGQAGLNSRAELEPVPQPKPGVRPTAEPQAEPVPGVEAVAEPQAGRVSGVEPAIEAQGGRSRERSRKRWPGWRHRQCQARSRRSPEPERNPEPHADPRAAAGVRPAQEGAEA